MASTASGPARLHADAGYPADPEELQLLGFDADLDTQALLSGA